MFPFKHITPQANLSVYLTITTRHIIIKLGRTMWFLKRSFAALLRVLNFPNFYPRTHVPKFENHQSKNGFCFALSLLSNWQYLGVLRLGTFHKFDKQKNIIIVKAFLTHICEYFFRISLLISFIRKMVFIIN